MSSEDGVGRVGAFGALRSVWRPGAMLVALVVLGVTSAPHAQERSPGGESPAELRTLIPGRKGEGLP